MKLKKSGKPKTEKERIEQRRKEVLATGRKFKYPLQFTKSAVVSWTIIIALVALVALGVLGWAALYRFQSTDSFFYQVTRVLPVPVATVDGKSVRYSDYLMLYRSSITALTRQSGSLDEDSRSALETQYKRTALTSAEKYAYAEKLAEEQGITVDDSEVEAEFTRHQETGSSTRSREAFLKIVSVNFGLDESEYRRLLKLSLLREKVEDTIDTEAKDLVEDVDSLLDDNSDFSAVASELGDSVIYENTNGLVSISNIDGGRAATASTLAVGAVSSPFLSTSGDGYYFVKLLAKEDDSVSFESLKIPFTKFDSDFENLKNSGLISEKIVLSE